MKIVKFMKWRTEDGEEHTTPEMANQHILNLQMIEVMASHFSSDSAQDVLNLFSGHRKLVREWLNSCDAMEKAALR